MGDFRYLEVLEGFPNCSTKKFEQRNVEFNSFYGAGSNRILGNDKGVGVPAFTNRKIKTTKKRNTQEWPWVKGQHCILVWKVWTPESFQLQLQHGLCLFTRTIKLNLLLHIRSARLTLNFLPVAVYGLNRNPKDQTGNNSHWTWIKASILQSYLRGISRPVTLQFL